MEIVIGRLYHRNRLVPVPKAKNLGFLSKVERKTVKTEDLVLVLRSEDGGSVIFLDGKGNDIEVSVKELNNELDYINNNFKRAKVKEFVLKKALPVEYRKVVDAFYNKPETQKRYKGWEGLEVNGELNESAYKINGMYASKDGDFNFIIKKKTKTGYRVLDLDTGKHINVDLADLELTRPKFVEMVKER